MICNSIELCISITALFFMIKIVSNSTYFNKSEKKLTMKEISVDAVFVFISCYIGIMGMNMYMSNISSVRTPAFTCDPEF